MNIVCAGMSRSGSTLQYQLISALVELNGGKGEGSWEQHKLGKQRGMLVFKSERWLPHATKRIDHAFAIIRDPRDALVSLYRYRLAKEYMDCIGKPLSIMDTIIGEMVDVMSWITWWEEFGAHIIRYEDCYPDHWHLIVRQAADVLKLRISDGDCNRIVEKYSIEKNIRRMHNIATWFDYTDTMLTLAHISPNAGRPGEGKKILNGEMLTVLGVYCHDFMERHGYL